MNLNHVGSTLHTIRKSPYRPASLVLILIQFLLSPHPAHAAPNIPSPAPAFMTGGDASLFAEYEQAGGVYKDHGTPSHLPEIFKAHGCEYVRLRLWTRDPARPTPPPLAQLNDLDYTIALAKRVKQAGCKIILTMHYSDTWADPGKQYTPAEWKDLPFDQLTQKVHDYTRDVIATMKREGVLPEIVQIGNEITNGMLWPLGKLGGKEEDAKTRQDRFTTLVKAGIRGAREGAGPGSGMQLMIHADTGGSPGKTQWFFDILQAHGVTDYDLIGLSFYPHFGGDLGELPKTLALAARRYHKPIVVVETAYPWSTTEWSKTHPSKHEAQLIYPKTLEGQRDYTRRLIEIVKQTPEGLGRGVIWWGAECIPAQKRLLGEEWNRMSLFNGDGNALPALEELGKATRVAPHSRPE